VKMVVEAGEHLDEEEELEVVGPASFGQQPCLLVMDTVTFSVVYLYFLL